MRVGQNVESEALPFETKGRMKKGGAQRRKKRREQEKKSASLL